MEQFIADRHWEKKLIRTVTIVTGAWQVTQVIHRVATTLPRDFEDSKKTKTSEYTNAKFNMHNCIKYKVQKSRAHNLFRAAIKKGFVLCSTEFLLILK